MAKANRLWGETGKIALGALGGLFCAALGAAGCAPPDERGEIETSAGALTATAPAALLPAPVVPAVKVPSLVPPHDPSIFFRPELEHQVTVVVGGRRFRLQKLARGESFFELAYDETGRQVSPDELRRAYLAPFTRFGRLHPTLYRQLESGTRALHEISIWLALSPQEVLERPAEGDGDSGLAQLAGRHAANLKRLDEEKRALMPKLGLAPEELLHEAAGTPIVVARVKPERLKQLAENPAVHFMTAYDPKGRLDLADAMAIARADVAIAGGSSGKGVRVGVFEGCADDTSQLVISDSHSAASGTACAPNWHTRHVTGIIRNTGPVTGFAPGATLFAADTYELAAFDWAVDTARVSALNQSFHRDDEILDGLQGDDLYKDYKVLHYPWTTVVHAAGNWCAPGTSCHEGGTSALDEFVNHKGFNTINAGNHDDKASAMSPSSCFVNPTTMHGDRELPEIAANGTGVTAVGLNLSGTSMSAPAVTGSIALLQQAQPILKIWPEGVRALLFAGAALNIPVHSGTTTTGAAVANAPNTWWRDVSLGNDGFDGAGALDIAETLRIAEKRWGNAADRGWDIGLLRDGSFVNGQFKRTYRFTAPPRATRAKVALAWNSTATARGAAPATLYASVLDLDLDVRVYDESGLVVGRSVSYDNSYEIVDFTPTPGKTYTIKVRRFSGPPAAWSWFGIAWAAR